MEDVRRWFKGSGDCADEGAFFDSVAREPARLSGIKVSFYSLDRAQHRDPLYGEPTLHGKWSFDGPYDLMAAVEYMGDSVQPEASESGIKFQADAILWIARAELENVGAPDPKEGDVVSFWGDSEYDGFAEPSYMSHWDVVKATADGYIISTPKFTMWKLELRRRSEFDASRRVGK